MQRVSREVIGLLAYKLWQEAGEPEGSEKHPIYPHLTVADGFWHVAEMLLSTRQFWGKRADQLIVLSKR